MVLTQFWHSRAALKRWRKRHDGEPPRTRTSGQQSVGRLSRVPWNHWVGSGRKTWWRSQWRFDPHGCGRARLYGGHAFAAGLALRELACHHRYPPRGLRVARGAQVLTAGQTGIVALPHLPRSPARLPALRPSQELVAAAGVAVSFFPTFAQGFRSQPGLSDHFLGYHRLASAPGRASARRRSRERPAEPTPGCCATLRKSRNAARLARRYRFCTPVTASQVDYRNTLAHGPVEPVERRAVGGGLSRIILLLRTTAIEPPTP
jgi:hypothetical protein